MTELAAKADQVDPSEGQTGPRQARWRTLSEVVLPRLLSVILLLVIWEVVSRAVSADVLPSLGKVYGAFVESLEEGYVWTDMVITFSRVLAAFSFAMLMALSIGLAIGTMRWFARMFDFWVTIAASVPSILYIVIAYLWLGLNDTAAVVAAALIVTPSATFNVIQGVRAIDPGLSEMARAFRVSKRDIIFRVLLPQTLPYLFAAARTGLALTWKIVIFVELMGRSSGVGYRIQYFYSLFNMERVLASALPFMVVMLLVELVIIRRLEAHLFRWRREESR